MLNLLFWNLKRKTLAESVGLLAEEKEADIVVLAEMPDGTDEILARLRQYDSDFLAGDEILPRRRVSLYHRFSAAQMQRLHDAKFWTIYQLVLSDEEPLILHRSHASKV